MICQCGKSFVAARKWQRFCSARCRRVAFDDGAAEVCSVRQIKTGWSVTLHMKRQPPVNIGEIASVMRSERISETTEPQV